MAVLGFISLICFLALVVKYPLRKLKFYRANAFTMKLHEAASLGVFLAGAAQMIKGIKNCGRNKFAAVVSGIAAYVADVIIIVACHMTKDVRKKMRDHRVLSLISCIALAVHILAVLLVKKRERE